MSEHKTVFAIYDGQTRRRRRKSTYDDAVAWIGYDPDGQDDDEWIIVEVPAPWWWPMRHLVWALAAALIVLVWLALR